MDKDQKTLLIIKDKVQAKAYLNETRMSILSKLSENQKTVSQVAKEMDVPPANITHHFKLLEKVGLIDLVEKLDTGRNLEKYYLSSAKYFEVDMTEGQMDNPVSEVLSILKKDLACGVKSAIATGGKDSAVGYVMNSKISPERFSHFAQKLKELIYEFRDDDQAGEQSYTMNVSLYTGGMDYGPLKKIQITKKQKNGEKK